MEESYFHIGLHKTGTTYLQRAVFPRLKDINYISQEKIAWILRSIATHDPLIFDCQTVRQRLRNCFRMGKNLISAESLSGNPFLQYMNRSYILNKIHGMFPKAKIVICIRSQVEILVSLYKQFVKMGGTKRFSELIEPIKDLRGPQYDYLSLKMFRYSLYLRKIEEYFGSGNMHVCVYENLVKDADRFLLNLLSFMDVEIVPQFSSKRENVSPHDSELYIHLVLNRFFQSPRNVCGIPKPPRGYPFLCRLLSRFTSKKHDWLIPAELKKELRSYYREDNELIDVRYDLGLQRDHRQEYF
ncbi:MAG: sulfotransferase [Deltaproteobacteria bacterium]|jgi:hypothetical protein|nr:sulfotransferase [Deltaproteobacteria bacterium]